MQPAVACGVIDVGHHATSAGTKQPRHHATTCNRSARKWQSAACNPSTGFRAPVGHVAERHVLQVWVSVAKVYMNLSKGAGTINAHSAMYQHS